AWLRLCFPPMYQPIHCMHSKLMLLFHPEKLRIAIPSANLLTFDWGETGVMENSVFIIDLPRLPDGGKAEADELPPFAQELLYFLRRQQLDRDVREGLLNFDFSATEGMMFVHTVGGSHFDDEAERTGLSGLAHAVRQLGLESQDGLQVDFAASSIGSLNDDFLKTVHAAARGEDMIARAETATTTTKPKADFFKPSTTTTPRPRTAAATQDIRDLLRIYFPTHNTVTASKAGSAGTICLNRKWFESEKFPRTCFRDYRSTRTGLLSHNKIL
ncbi:tyrosyl-DNA phosphodiesterase I, partial [Neohortaea acidophila]